MNNLNSKVKVAPQLYSTLENEDPDQIKQKEIIEIISPVIKPNFIYYLKNIKKVFTQIFNHFIFKFCVSLILTVLWIYYYIISLEGCAKEQAECLKSQDHRTAFKIGFRIFYSSLYFLILILSTYILKIAYKIFFYISITTMIFLFYIYDTGADFANHGAYNRVFFYLFFTCQVTAVIILYSIIAIFRKHYIITPITLFLLFTFSTQQIKKYIKNSCDDWDKGMKNSQIDNRTGICRINKPRESCFLYLTENLFDVSALRGMSCKNRNLDEERNLLKSYLSEDLQNAKRIGFPRTENWDFFPDCTLENYNRNIFKNMVDMNSVAGEDIKKDVEVFIDFEDGEYPEVVIEVKKNDTLILEREEIIKNNNNSPPMFKNVIQIYLDAISRNHFRKKLKKTFKWLERFYNDTSTDYSSYQFLKYHSLDYYTYANMIPGYFGTHKWEEYNTPYFLHQYKSNGYITGQSSNVCEKEGWDLETVFQPYLNYTNYDHEFNGFYCDPNFSDPDKPYNVFKGAYSVIRKCMYGKDSGEFQIDYAKQFLTTYKDQNKFFRMMFSDAHEGTMEVVKYLDDPIENFLQFLLNEGHLEKSVLLIMSDHGVSMPGPAFIWQADDWYREVFLGTLFYVIPKKHQNYNNLDANLKYNENVIVTSFDIHANFLNFVNESNVKTKYGLSLFSNSINDFYRTCLSYKIESGNCICNLM